MNSTNSIWDQARKMLLVVEYTTYEDMQKFREALKEIGLNVHECHILVVVKSKKEKDLMRELSNVTYISDQEINFLGRLKNEEATKILSQRYDILVLVGDLSSKLQKIIKKAKITWTVGVNTSVEFLTINMTTESAQPLQLLNFVKQTLKKIN